MSGFTGYSGSGGGGGGACAGYGASGTVERATQTQVDTRVAVGVLCPLFIGPAQNRLKLVTVGNGLQFLNVLNGAGVGSIPNDAGPRAVDWQAWRTAITQVASAYYTTAVGQSNSALGVQTVAVGYANLVDGVGAVIPFPPPGTPPNVATNSGAFGISNTVTGYRSVAIGFNNVIGTTPAAVADDAVALGSNNTIAAGSANSIAIGRGIALPANSSGGVAIGYGAVISGVGTAVDSVAIGTGATALNGSSVAIGNGAIGDARAVGIGDGASAGSAYAVAIGRSASAWISAVAVGYGASAGFTGSVAVGYGASVTYGSTDGIAIGTSAFVDAVSAVAIGESASVNVASATALGASAVNRITKTHNISGPSLIRKDNTEPLADALQFFSGDNFYILTPEIDLTAVAADYAIAVPAGASFWVEEVGVIVSTLGGAVTLQPTVQFGITGTPAKWLAPTLCTLLTALRKRERFTLLLTDDGETSMSFGVTVPGTVAAGAFSGRAFFRGMLVEDE